MPSREANEPRSWKRSGQCWRPTSAERVGGSRAQRDLLEYTVTCAHLRHGQRDEALQLISRRRPANGKGGYPLAGLHQG